MHGVRRILFSALAALMAAPVAVAQQPGTITEIVAASGGEFDGNRNDFDVLLNAVLTAELDGALADPHANVTVFAPTDRAFIRLAAQFGYLGNDEGEAFAAIVSVLTELGNGDPIPLLTDILLYHVSPDAKSIHEILSADIIETLLEGATFVPVRRLLDNDPDIPNPLIIRTVADIEASNGIIQPINRVLIPLDVDNVDGSALPTIAAAVAASGGTFDSDLTDFDVLLNAVTAAGLVDALNNPADNFTVYAPTDAAFVRTARVLGFHGHDEAGAFQFIVDVLTALSPDGDPITLLTPILLYHVSPDGYSLKETLESLAVSTLFEDATLQPNPFDLSLGDNDPNLRDPRLLVPLGDIRLANGFVHPISRVLIPLDLSTL